MDVRYLPAGDTALVVEFGDNIDRAVNDRVLALSDLIRASALDGVIEIVPTFRSLMIHYNPLATGAAHLTGWIREHVGGIERRPASGRLWRVPACYAPDCAPDLDAVAAATKLTAAEVVEQHRRTRFHVYMIGFLPGFPYMGGLPEALHLPRRSDPRVRVPAGSIAIAMAMTGIYPVESPGGWHLIASTAVRLFDAGRSRPALLAAGDAVFFEPVTAAEHQRIQAAVAAGDYALESEETGA